MFVNYSKLVRVPSHKSYCVHMYFWTEVPPFPIIMSVNLVNVCFAFTLFTVSTKEYQRLANSQGRNYEQLNTKKLRIRKVVTYRIMGQVDDRQSTHLKWLCCTNTAALSIQKSYSRYTSVE